MTFIIDRFEGNFAVVEKDGQTYNIPKNLLPPGAKEGSVLDISLNEEKTSEAEKEAENLLDELFERCD